MTSTPASPDVFTFRDSKHGNTFSWWREIVYELGGDAGAAGFVYWEIIARCYDDPSRRYHTIGHVENCLSMLNENQRSS